MGDICLCGHGLAEHDPEDGFCQAEECYCVEFEEGEEGEDDGESDEDEN